MTAQLAQQNLGTSEYNVRTELTAGRRFMNLKDILRPILPPTSRAFEAQSDILAKRLDSLSSQITTIPRQIEDISDRLIQLESEQYPKILEKLSNRLTKLESENVALREQVTRLSHHAKYYNYEYVSKLIPQESVKVLLAGWYGAENFGDELMLRTILDFLPKDILPQTAVLLWDNYSYPRDAIDPCVTLIHYPQSTWQLDQLARQFDVLVWGGGAIIDDRQYNEDPSNTSTGNLFIRLSKSMIALGKSVYCLGLSSNDSISNMDYARELDLIVNCSKLFSLRDPYSLQTLRSSGIRTEKVVLCEDLVFANDALRQLPKHPNAGGDTGSLRIAFVPLTTESQFNHYVGILNRVIREIEASGHAYEISIIPFYNEEGHDSIYCQSLLSAIENSASVHVEPYAANIKDLRFNSYDLVIAYKYHAALISLVQETPTICVVDSNHPHYLNKMRHLTSLFSVGDALTPQSDFDEAPFEHVKMGLESGSRPAPCLSIIEGQQRWLLQTCLNIARID